MSTGMPQAAADLQPHACVDPAEKGMGVWWRKIALARRAKRAQVARAFPSAHCGDGPAGNLERMSP